MRARQQRRRQDGQSRVLGPGHRHFAGQRYAAGDLQLVHRQFSARVVGGRPWQEEAARRGRLEIQGMVSGHGRSSQARFPDGSGCARRWPEPMKRQGGAREIPVKAT